MNHNKLVTQDNIMFSSDSRDTHLSQYIQSYVTMTGNSFQKIVQGLTPRELDIAFCMIKFIEPKTNILKYQGRILSAADLAILLRLKPNALKRFLKNLINKDVLKMTDVSGIVAYIVTPYLYFRGDIISNRTYKLFEGTRWAVYENIQDRIDDTE